MFLTSVSRDSLYVCVYRSRLVQAPSSQLSSGLCRRQAQTEGLKEKNKRVHEVSYLVKTDGLEEKNKMWYARNKIPVLDHPGARVLGVLPRSLGPVGRDTESREAGGNT